MEKEKSPDESQSAKSESSIETVVSGSNKAVVVRNETQKMGKNRSEHAGPRRKMEPPTMWNPEPHTYTMNVMLNHLQAGLRHCSSGDERDILNQSFRPEGNFLWYKIISEVKSDLFNALASSYPSMRLEVYGSTLMGFAFRDSDLDIYVNTSPKPTPTIGEVLSELHKSPSFAKFGEPEMTRTPILNCLHIKTGYWCRLNFSDPIGPANSAILAHLLTYDPRIDFLATVIKSWMKVHHCYGFRRITNYGVMWLLVFFLQSIPSPIIPPIIQFQMGMPEVLINGFNFAFDFDRANNTRNEQRCAELLLDFFKFYERFDFENLVISPLYGRAFQKNDVKAKRLAEFTNYEALLKRDPDKNPMNMKDRICIQDPFEITNSIPVHFAPKVFARFADKISAAADIIEYELHQAGESTNLFLKLFDVDLFHQEANAKALKNQFYTKF